MRNRLLSLLTVTTVLHAGSAIAQDQTTYIHSDDIVPYQDPAAFQANAAPSAEAVAPQKDSAQEPPCDSDQPQASLEPQVTEPQAETAAGQVAEAPAPAPVSHANYVYPTRAPAMIDPETRTWLNLQTSGSMAGTHYKTSGQTATQIYQRYLKSFTYPIPEKFEREPSTSGSSGGN